MKKIKSKIIRLLSNKLIKIFFIITLVCFWLAGLFLFANYVSFSVLTNNHNLNSSDKKLFKGEFVSAEFVATENNLGIVMLPFKQYAKPDYEKEDQLKFEIKEKNSKNIYFNSIYRSGLVNGGYFPFGFPTISNSKNKIYQFQLTSLKGNERNGLSISDNEFISGYQFSKHEIFNENKLITFFISKLRYSIKDSYLLFSSIIFLLPLIAYILFLQGVNKNNRFDRLITIFFYILLIANLFVIGTYYGVLGLNILLWIYLVWKNNLKSTATFKLAFFIFFIWLSVKFINVNYPQQNFNILCFVLLVIGVIQAIMEEKREKI